MEAFDVLLEEVKHSNLYIADLLRFIDEAGSADDDITEEAQKFFDEHSAAMENVWALLKKSEAQALCLQIDKDMKGAKRE
jgi:hypothetical protein